MSGTNRFQTAALALLLLVGGVLAWTVQLRPPLLVDTAPLAELPREILGWHASVEVPLETEVEKMLRADINLQRIYELGGVDSIGLYVGYYGTERGGRPEHTPDVCYPTAGFTILERQIVSIDPTRGLRAIEFLVEREGRHQLVQFWYRSYRSTGLLGPGGQIWDRLIGRLVRGRSDGALVRVTTPVRPGDEFGARSRLAQLAAEADRLLDQHWPIESAQRS
jgi:EpsI family protein